MATVTMDINELDKLRQDLKDSQNNFETLNKELNAVKSDKRVIVRKKLPTKDDFIWGFDGNKAQKLAQQGYRDNIYKECITIHPIILTNEDSTEFINFDDAIAELSKKIEENYINELAELRSCNKNYGVRELELKKDFDREKKQINKDFSIKINGYEEKLELQKKAYSELESGKKEQSEIDKLNQVIDELNKKCIELNNDLYKERNKVWWKKLLNL